MRAAAAPAPAANARADDAPRGVIKEKTDAALFAVDVGGDDATERRLARIARPLRAEQILAARSAVKAVDTRKRTGDDPLTDGVIEKRKKRSDGVSHAQLQRLRAIAYGGAKSAPGGVLAASRRQLPDYDPWAANAGDRFKDATVRAFEKLDFVENPQPVRAPVTLKRVPTALTAIGSVPAVRTPAPGISYNPDFDKWDALLQAEGAKEVSLERKRLAVEAEDERIQALVDDSDQEFLSDKSGDEHEDSSDDDSDDDAETKAKREAKRKTQAQKNKTLRLKERERKDVEAKSAKKQERELMMIKKYTRDVKLEERMRMARKIARMTAPDDDAKDPQIMRKKRFGKVQYVCPQPPGAGGGANTQQSPARAAGGAAARRARRLAAAAQARGQPALGPVPQSARARHRRGAHAGGVRQEGQEVDDGEVELQGLQVDGMRGRARQKCCCFFLIVLSGIIRSTNLHDVRPRGVTRAGQSARAHCSGGTRA